MLIQTNQAVSSGKAALLKRILASAAFHRSTRSRQLLEYLAARHFSGSSEPIHEAQIGVELFGRGADFDPSADSIVRASIRQLRARLAEFYETEGAGEEIGLYIPKGEYRLCFEPRSHTAAASTPAPSRGTRLWTSRHRTAFTLLALVAVAGLSFFLGARLRPSAPPITTQSPVATNQSILDHFLNSTTGPVHFVPSDSVINLIQSLTKEPISFEDYESRRAFDPESVPFRQDPGHWRSLVSRELLNIGDAAIVLRALRENSAHAQRFDFRQSRDLQLRDLRSGNYIFLGSIAANPWIRVFEPQLNFLHRQRIEGEPRRWRNLVPRDGEEPWYPPAGEAPASGDRSYVQVACIPNLSRSGLVLLIAGNSQPNTEAAGEFVLSPQSAVTLASAIGVSKLSDSPGFDVLLGTEQTGNAWRVTEVVAHRILSPKVAHASRAQAPGTR